jgi:hypothetical protein
MSFPESADYVNQLDDQKPNGQDPISYGDNHIRLIKKAVHDSFPKVGGEVTATHEELSYVSGVTGPIQDQLDDGFQQIVGNDNDISALEGRMDSAETRLDGHDSDIAALQAHANEHEIGDHPDVEFEGAPEDGDVMVFDGGKWRAKKPQSGNVMRMNIAQPQTCGDFTTHEFFRWDAYYQRPSNGGSPTRTFTFTNPQQGDLKFMLRNIKINTRYGAGLVGADLAIDGFKPFAGWGGKATVSLFPQPNTPDGGYDWDATVFPIPRRFKNGLYENDTYDDNAPLIEVKDAITIPINSISANDQWNDGDVRVIVEGWFVEDK